MKIRYVFLLLSLFVLFGCDSDTEKYIKLNEKDLSSFEMLEETKLNGIYSPYEDLHSVLLAQSFYSVDLSKLYSEYISNNSDSLRNALSELIIKYDSISPSLDSIVAKAHVAYKVPEQFKGDSKAIKAKYRANGKLKEKYFYYNVDSKEISNTSDDIEALLVDAQSKSTNLFLQVLEIKKEINYQ